MGVVDRIWGLVGTVFLVVFLAVFLGIAFQEFPSTFNPFLKKVFAAILLLLVPTGLGILWYVVRDSF